MEVEYPCGCVYNLFPMYNYMHENERTRHEPKYTVSLSGQPSLCKIHSAPLLDQLIQEQQDERTRSNNVIVKRISMLENEKE